MQNAKTNPTDTGVKSVIVLNQEQIEQTTKEVLSLHSQIEGFEKNALQFAIKAGKLLTSIKGSLGHGKWKDWIAQHTGKGFSDVTMRRYMRLAKRSQGTDLTNVTGLNEAYAKTGIKTPSSDNKDDGKPTPENVKEPKPEKVKKDNEIEYTVRLNNACSQMKDSVEGEIQSAGVNWDLSTWTITGDKLSVGHGDTMDATNRLFDGVAKWVSTRNFPELTHEDEIRNKMGSVLFGILKTILIKNRKTETDKKNFFFEVNEAVEERVAA